MLSKDFELTDQLYNPINNLTQMELMEKFNIAFYEGQNLSRYDISKVFEEYTPSPKFEKPPSPVEEDHIPIDILVDYLTEPDTPTANLDFDFDDLNNTLDFTATNRRQASFSESDSIADSETYVTDSDYKSGSVRDDTSQFSELFNPVQYQAENNETLLDSLDLDDICESLSNNSFDFNELSYDICDFNNGGLSEMGTDRTNTEFNQFLRTVPADDLSFSAQESIVKNEFGHLVRNKCHNNNETSNFMFTTENNTMCFTTTLSDNQAVIPQNENLIMSDPFFETSLLNDHSLQSMCQEESSLNSSSESEDVRGLSCKWENCFQTYPSQTSLVKHIEKCHVEFKKSGDEFVCYWLNCPRKVKPFNARYKLLIHMRVHSGEKPNKCPFKGCTKAFSRLENLKIHQRSHTGERPYLCQFPSCPKSFSNSSDRAKHQRTHFDTKPYGCQVRGCTKKYTDPSSLRKHVKNHTTEEQLQLKNKSAEEHPHRVPPNMSCRSADHHKRLVINPTRHYTTLEHNYSNTQPEQKKSITNEIKRDLKNKISQRNNLFLLK
ncbi:zinc finger protein 677-like [Coccinella septempunctata]|uniref:zinc finger protein 677-like n=1 Tax=Coccinella septempunctata TaxID=41139 RepID=UPI001D098E9A|nr:zinc finger protein 677-like [Coccinella septempunctata]XP_044763663.1 zinc finger protein 677-like [Coccinella septempunctata]